MNAKDRLIKMITNRLKVTSIVTITLTIVFSYLAITSVISGDEFMTVFSIVIAFYFGAQAQKIADGKQEE